jgi:lipoic acid synthetase
MIPRLLAEVNSELPPGAPEGPWATETLLFTQLPVEEALGLALQAAEQMAVGKAPGHRLLLLEHPATLAYGPEAAGRVTLSAAVCQELMIRRLEVPGMTGAEYAGPGMLFAYLTYSLEHGVRTPDAVLRMLQQVVVNILAQFELAGEVSADGRTIAARGKTVATLEVTPETLPGHGLIVQARVALHTNTDPEHLAYLAGDWSGLTTLTALGVPIERQDEIRAAWLRNYEMVFESQALIPQKQGLRTAKPPWLKARIPFGPGTERVHSIIEGNHLHTVCESARCPNMGECWRAGTATFMINGNVCTRSCSFCAIFTGRPQPLDPDEPRRVADAARTMDLKYVVVTSVNRDERKDGGAPQFAETIRELRKAIDGLHIEVLIPDFRGNAEALETVFAAGPDVLNHNLETVPRLYPWVRPQAVYQRSLDVLRAAHAYGLTAKSGIMVGLGEEPGEIEQTLLDLRAHGCDIVTIGQYLRPSEKHHPVVRYVTPAEFDGYREAGEKMGFKTVEAGPLVRSSYHAHLSYRRHTDGNR